jgi:hypothetical protein
MSKSTQLVILAVVAVLVVGSGISTHSFESTRNFGILVAAWLTLAIYSFLYQDNPVYKLAEHLFVGIAAAYGGVIAFWEVIVPKLFYQLFAPNPALTGEALRNWSPDWVIVIPFLFGLFFFARFTKKHDYMVRWSLAFLIGGYAGARLTAAAEGDLVVQAASTMLPIWGAHFFPPWPYLRVGPYGMNHLFIVVGVISTLAYFFFSKPHRGVLGGTAKLGIWFLMVAFGASFGYTVMARISLLIGRLLFLMSDWLHLSVA